MSQGPPREPLGAPAGDRARARRDAWWLWVAGLLPFALLAWHFRHLTDDAYISFRYARNLARGDGLVYNPGLAPVEGYSNLLWVLVLALGEGVGFPAPRLAPLLSFAAGAAALALLARFLARAIPARACALWAMLFLALFPPFALWSTGGLETAAQALCVLALYVLLAGEPARPRGWAAGLVAACAVLLRVDGAVLVAAVLAVVAWRGWRDHALRRALIVCALLALSALLAQLAFRCWYYGDWLPNSARAKLHPGQLEPGLRLDFWRRGLDYAASFLAVFPSAALALLLAAGARGTARARHAASAAWITGLALAYVVAAGGDFMAMFRLLVPVTPLLALALAIGLQALAERGKPLLVHATGAVLTLAALAPAFGWHTTPARLRRALDFRWNAPAPVESEHAMWLEQRERTAYWVLLGRALALHVQPGERIFLGAIGAVGYHTELEVLDSYGLVTPEVTALAPRTLSLPGHDRQAELELFRARPPHYAGAKLAQAADPYAVLPPDLRPPRTPPGIRLEVHPLDPSDGFPQDAVLVLIRLES